MRWCVLLKYGELALKGRNRGRFEATLLDNVRRGLADLPDVTVERRHGLLVVEGAPTHLLVERAVAVLGVALVHPAVRVEPRLDAIESAAVELLRPRAATTFAVRSRRRWKGFEARSSEIAVRVGDLVRTQLHRKVDLRHPDVVLGIEVDRTDAFLYTERLRGQGGLPPGVNGRALVLLSGGYDSPVAGYRALRRGLATDYVHFSGLPFTSPDSVYKAYALVSRLDRYRGGGSRLWVVSFGNAQRSLATAGAGRLQVLAQRRLMVRVASRIASASGAQALVSGDSLGQVASQTLPNLVAVEAAAELPLLRPLLGYDKAEIVAEARRIGTAEVSALPDEDCCTLFAPRVAETRARMGELARVERRVDVDPLVELLVAGARSYDFGASPGRAA
jgi:thiamine biosynthesis protein ThiI